MKRRRQMLCAVSLAGLVMGAGEALAQPTPGAPSANQTQPGGGRPDNPGVAPAQAGATATQLEEVVVTAEKRSENVQKTPIAISTISGAALKQAGVNTTQDLDKLVPDLDVRNNGGGVQLYIRGVGSQIANGFGDPAVAFSADGVYFSRPVGPDLTLYDLDRIEVLKGPQGTLYGRNATGGAINAITAKPTLDGYHADATLELGDYSLVHFEGAANLPVNDQLGLRVAIEHITHDGYETDGYDNQDVTAGRIHMLWKPNAKLSVLLSGDYGFEGGKGSGYLPHDGSFVTSNPYEGPSSAPVEQYVVSKGQIAPANFKVADGYIDNHVGGVSADITYDLGFGEITLLPAYRRTVFNDNFFIGSLGQVQTDKDNQETVEARIASNPGSRLQWLGGFFFLNEAQDFSSVNVANQGLLQTSIITPDISDVSYAGFGQLTYSVLDNFRLTGGLRYTYEHKETTNGTYNVVPDPAGLTLPPALTGLPFPISVPVPGGAESSDGDQRFYDLSYRAGFEWDVRPRSMVYANVSTGFHAGGLNPGTLTPDYAPEKLTAYALGAKNRFFDNRVQLNAEAYYWDYDNLQIQHLGPVVSPGGEALTGFITDNAGKARLYGIDVDATWLVTRDDQLSASFLLNENKYIRYAYNVVISGQPPTSINASGQPLINSPRFSGTVGYAHTFRLPEGKVVASLNSKLSSSFHGSPLDEPGTIQSGYTRTDLGLTYDAPGDRWSLTGYVRNVEDRAVISLVTNRNPSTRDAFYGTPAAPSNAVSGTYVTLNPPRTFGVLATAHF